MTQAEYRKNNGKWFSGKKATVSRTIHNKGGKSIEQGEIVMISCKSGRGGFNIQSEIGVYISQVNWADIEMLVSST